MARVIGSEAGGYATVTPTDNYIGEALRNNEANAFKYREEQRMKEAKAAAQAKAKADALDKQAEDDLKDADRLDAIRAKDSGISGIDSAVVNGMQSQREKYIDATQRYKATGDKKYLVERSVAMNNLQSIANIPTSYQKVVDLATQGVANGTLDEEELKRITDVSDQIEKGIVVPKIENGIMTFDVFGRDPNTGKVSNIAIKNMKGEELINQLTPQKKFDYIKHIKDTQDLAGNATTSVINGIEVSGYPDAFKFATQQANNLMNDKTLLSKVAKKYGIEEDPQNGFSDEDIQKIYKRYYADVIGGLNTGKRRDYEGERMALAREEEKRKKKAAVKEDKTKSFKPAVNVVTKGGNSISLGVPIVKGDKILAPTYEKGKDGPVKGVVLNDKGEYVFSISSRKDNSLNATGQANKKAFEDKPENAGKEYKPTDNEYLYSANKPTGFNLNKNAEVIEPYIRGMINPETGEYFQNSSEYIQAYDKYKPKKTGSATAKKQATPAKPKAPVKKEDLRTKYNY